jgi:hypothetical protein
MSEQKVFKKVSQYVFIPLSTLLFTLVATTFGALAAPDATYPPNISPTLSPVPTPRSSTKTAPPLTSPERATAVAAPVIADATKIQNGAVTSVVTENGVTSTARVSANNANTGVQFAARGWTVSLSSSMPLINNVKPSNANSPIAAPLMNFVEGAMVTFSGGGFAPLTTVDIYIFSDPIYLGQTMTDAKGSFNASLKVTKTLSGGDHILQMRGTSATNQVMTVSLPVVVSKKPIKVQPSPSKNPGSEGTDEGSTGGATAEPSPTAVIVTPEPEPGSEGSKSNNSDTSWIGLLAVPLAAIFIFILAKRRRREDPNQIVVEKVTLPVVSSFQRPTREFQSDDLLGEFDLSTRAARTPRAKVSKPVAIKKGAPNKAAKKMVKRAPIKKKPLSK